MYKIFINCISSGQTLKVTPRALRRLVSSNTKVKTKVKKPKVATNKIVSQPSSKDEGKEKVTRKGVKRKNVKTPSGSKNKGKILSNFDMMVPIFEKSTGISGETIEEYISKTADVHNEFIKNLGVQFGTKHYKAIVLYCTLLCEGRVPEPVARVSTGKRDKWPKCFGFLRPLYHDIIDNRDKDRSSSVEKLRLLTTLFKLNRVSSDLAVLDVENIALKFPLPKDVEEGYIKYLSERLGDTPEIETNRFNVVPFFGPSKGPNNLPKEETANMEAAALLSSSMHVHFRTLCQLTDNVPFYNYFVHCAENYMKTNPEADLSKVRLRKLAAVPDSGNKSRTVAICDFWTQTVLQPLEEDLKKKLTKEFPKSTAYFSHSNGFNELKQKWSQDLVSIDAEAWTDNFPARLQYLTAKQCYGQQFAIAWQSLAVKCPWYVGNTDSTVIYGKGQGMGTKGSFMMATYCDHHFIEYKYREAYGEVLYYKKVGDDLVVQDPRNVFGEFYTSIGVPINKFKSKGYTPNGHFVEFVSRSAWDGQDYSPVSPKLIAKARKQPFLIITLVNHLLERFEPSSLPSLEELLNSTRQAGKDTEKFDVHLSNVKLLIKLYQELSGVHIINIDEDISFGHYNRLMLAIIQKMIELGFKPESPEDEFNLEDSYEYTSDFRNSEYDCQWHYFLDNDFSVGQVKNFNYAMSVSVRTEAQKWSKYLDYGGIHQYTETHPKRFVALCPNSPLFDLYEVTLLMQVLMEIKCQATNMRILEDLNMLHTKNAKPTVELLKCLNECVKEARRDKDWNLSMRDQVSIRQLGLLRVYNKYLKLI